MQSLPDDLFADWQAHRQTAGKQPKVSYTITDCPEEEAAQIAKKILSHYRSGISFKDQAIICRTHKQLARFAEKLTAENIPVFYLGILFERDEIADLLALLDLCDSETGVSLVRAANFSEYRIPLDDVRRILEESGAENTDFQKVLLNDEIANELSDAGKNGWKLLKKHLGALPGESAYRCLCEYLFNQSGYLQYLLTDTDTLKQQNLLAIYQFLNFARKNEARFAEAEKPIFSFLRHVRKVVRYGEDNLFNQNPDCTEKIDAVKLLTIHGAKGLEFEVVYLPYLAKTKIPVRRKHEPCPPPVGMLAEEHDYHEEEEECLFFVAMSRAKNFLHLSRSKYDRNSSAESVFLQKLGNVLPNADIVNTAPEDQQSSEPAFSEQFSGIEFHHTQIEDYQRCPRLFYYRHVLKLNNPREDGVYLKFHTVLRKTISELMKAPKSILNQEFAKQKLDEFWAQTDLDEHPYSPVYRQKAGEMLQKMSERIAEESGGETIRPTFAVEFENGIVCIQPEFMQIENSLIKLRRSKTGKVPQRTEGGDDNSKIIEDADVLLQIAVAENYPNFEIEMKKFYLKEDEVRTIVPNSRIIANRLNKYEDSLRKIKSGCFAADPTNESDCINCAFYFICPG
jgi:CRISPR/Cas system-associated exonuclease Cas4 (RecB family)